MQSLNQHTRWAELLHGAVNEPGIISQAYSRFHHYSVGNQILAWFQCAERSIAPGPIATFMRWKELGRHVKKGEKALTLCMPIRAKRTETVELENGDRVESRDFDISWTRFVYRNHWFVLSQTEGAEFQPEPVPGWKEGTALARLDIARVAFDSSDGNCQGYAVGRKVAVNPLAVMPHKTLFHELAHVALGHTTESQLNDGSEITPRDIRELEAECVALLCCESLGLPGAEFSRGYIQSWYSGHEVPERSAQRIFHAADEILKAGKEEKE